MTQDEIIEMARRVNLVVDENQSGFDDLLAFAKLVAAKATASEREACAKVCDDLPAPNEYSNTDKSMWEVTCIDCADAVRARGEQA
jgi:hypothetical protein